MTDTKATHYRHVRQDPTFYARYHSMFPMLLITVSTESRKQRWHTGWKARWPNGSWLIATEADLAHDSWLEYRHGVERSRSFVDSWQPGEQQLPPHLRAGATAQPAAPAAAEPEKPRPLSLDWVFETNQPVPK